MIRKGEKKKKQQSSGRDRRIADSIIYADDFRDWSREMLSGDAAIEDVLTNAYEVKQVYEVYGDELWDVIFNLSQGEETVLECLERLSGFPIENEEDLMLQFMKQVWEHYKKEREDDGQ